jgi:hypothetical protein
MLTKLNHTVTLDVIDQHGVKIDEREVANAPFSVLYPEGEAAIIDWIAADGLRPTYDELIMPIQYGDKSLFGAFAWGSAVKRGQTLGFSEDLDLIQNAEDGQRVGRWLFANGLYGGLKGDLKIKLVKRGEVVPGVGSVDDGFGYIRREIAERGWSGLDKIHLGDAKENFTFWQRIPLSDGVRDEIEPLIHERLVDAADTTAMLFDLPSSFDDKKRLVEAEPQMIEHPFVANRLSAASAEHYTRIATTAPLGGVFRTAVPTTMPKVCWPGHEGKLIISRYPIDSDGSIQALEVSETNEYYQEAERIADLEVVQHTIATKEFFAKGCLGLVDELPGDYDVILCVEDVKLGGRRKQVELSEAVLVFTNWWDKGSMVGVNGAWAKDLMGLDHDGDGATVIEANCLPCTWEAARSLPHATTKKLIKTKSPISKGDRRPEMIIQSMSNIVGWATNLDASTRMVADREFMAKQLGYKSAGQLDKELNYFIKVGTDGFKTKVNALEVEEAMGRLQVKIRKLFGGLAPWTMWPDDWAFRHGVPSIRVEEGMGKVQAKHAIKPYMDGTIAEICRMTLPDLANILEEPIKVRLLTDFRSWALSVPKEVYERAKEVQTWYNARQARVNWSDGREVVAFAAEYRAKIQDALGDLDSRVAASALWRVAHSARSTNAGAGSVFIAYPDEVMWIIREKPGQTAKCRTVVTGLKYQLPQAVDLDVDVKVVEVKTARRGKYVIRKALVVDEALEGQRQPQGSYPTNMIGLVVVNADQPEVGEYMAQLRKVSDNAWECQLV